MPKRPIQSSCVSRVNCESGIVLPMALIMLVIISIAGLVAARNSASHEQFSNNMRTTQVARQSAEAALRYCELVVIDKISNNGAVYGKEGDRIVKTELAPDELATGAWNTKKNWERGAANLITYPVAFGSSVQDMAKLKSANFPTCLIQLMTEERFLITSRGLSNDAVTENNELTQGSEIWLQSVLSPGIPTKAVSGGNK